MNSFILKQEKKKQDRIFTDQLPPDSKPQELLLYLPLLCTIHDCLSFKVIVCNYHDHNKGVSFNQHHQYFIYFDVRFQMKCNTTLILLNFSSLLITGTNDEFITTL